MMCAYKLIHCCQVHRVEALSGNCTTFYLVGIDFDDSLVFVKVQ